MNSCLEESVNGLSVHNALHQKEKILTVMCICSSRNLGASISVSSLTLPAHHPFASRCWCDISWHPGNVFCTWLTPTALDFHSILTLASSVPSSGDKTYNRNMFSIDTKPCGMSLSFSVLTPSWKIEQYHLNPVSYTLTVVRWVF